MTHLDSQLETPGKSATLTPIAAILALLALALVWIPSATSAATPAAPDSRGVNGFAICETLDPTSSYYVPGDPVYISEIFQVKTDSPDYQQAFKDFLKQKYGWTKNVSCSVAYASDGATKTFNEKLKQAGPKLVRTGWTLASAGSPAASAAPAVSGSSSAAATGTPDPAAGSSYWVCRVTGADGKDYNSDIFRGSDGGYATFPTLFGQSVTSKYNVKFQSNPTCTDYGVLGQQQAQDALKGFASYSTGVMTGWKYGTSAPVSAAAASTAPATGTYFVCTWPGSAAGALTYFVSDVNGPAPAELGPGPYLGQLAPAFGSFVAAKYHAVNGAYNCTYKFSEADAQALKKRELTTPPAGYKAVDTGWKYGMQATAGGAAPTRPAPATPAAQSAAAPAAAQGTPHAFYICRAASAGTTYYSDAFNYLDNGAAPTTLANAYRQFLTTNYNVNIEARCISYGAYGEQQARNALKSYQMGGAKNILTGWKYSE